MFARIEQNMRSAVGCEEGKQGQEYAGRALVLPAKKTQDTTFGELRKP